jgi:PAS domain S-box-containing protein
LFYVVKRKMNNTVGGNSILCDGWLHILDELNIGAFTVDNQRHVSSMNLNAQALMGIRDTEAIGKDCREVFVGIPCLAKCPFGKPLNPDTEEPVIELLDESKQSHLVTRMAAPVYGRNHSVAGCMTILQDHSPIVDLVGRIHHEERSLKIILDNLAIGIFTVDRSGHITFFNSHAEKISGFNRRVVLGEPISTSIFEGAGAKELGLLNECMVDGESRSSQHARITTWDGVTVPVRANYMALRNEKGVVVGGLATFHDLTLVHRFKQALNDRYTFYDMIAKSPAMLEIFETVKVVAKTDATILIEGSTGTGKDLLAKVIHSESRRADKPFIKVNCAAIPDNLLESEMFGYVKGAFTGADKNRIGRFQEAAGGTIFLDEIGDLPLALQGKLLRVIEDKEFYRLGDHHTNKVNVRILSATNRDLEKLVDKRLFRNDLYYRLNVFRIEIPPLKDRKIDLPILIGHILRRLCAVKGESPLEVSENVMEILLNYDYPGNVRELKSILEHAQIICQEDTLQTRHLPKYLLRSPRRDSRTVEPEIPKPFADLDTKERDKILAALKAHNGQRIKTARVLDMDRTTLWRKMKKYGIID